MQKDKALIDQCMIHTSTNFERTVLGYPADHRGALLENGEGDLVQEKPCLVSAERCHQRFTKYPWQSMERAWHIQYGVFSAGLRAASRPFGALTRTAQAWHLFVASIESGIRWLLW